MTMPEVPVLTSSRLTFRGHTRDDFADSAAMWGDPQVTRYIGGRSFTEEEVWARLLRYVGHWAVVGFGFWAVRETTTGRFVGEVGFADFHRPIAPLFDGAPEAGWVLAPWAQGKGFGREAVETLSAWGEARFEGGRTVCIIHPDNAASIAVAERCGYRRYAQSEYHGDPTIVFERKA
jgi:RimJ/RimL family protein N-acetyltransferase